MPLRNGLAANGQQLPRASTRRMTHKLPYNVELVETDDPLHAGQALDPEREIQELDMLGSSGVYIRRSRERSIAECVNEDNQNETNRMSVRNCRQN